MCVRCICNRVQPSVCPTHGHYLTTEDGIDRQNASMLRVDATNSTTHYAMPVDMQLSHMQQRLLIQTKSSETATATTLYCTATHTFFGTLCQGSKSVRRRLFNAPAHVQIAACLQAHTYTRTRVVVCVHTPIDHNKHKREAPYMLLFGQRRPRPRQTKDTQASATHSQHLVSCTRRGHTDTCTQAAAMQ